MDVCSSCGDLTLAYFRVNDLVITSAAHHQVAVALKCSKNSLFLGHCHRRARQRGSSSL